MSTNKRRKLDADTASNASGRNGTGAANNASTVTGNAGPSGSRRAGGGGGGGPGSRGGHSAATASRAAAAAAAASSASSTLNVAPGPGGGSAALDPGASVQGQAYVPVLPLSALPISSLSKYALHYGLVPPEPLTIAQATFPTPPLPMILKLADSYTVPSRPGRREREKERERDAFLENGISTAVGRRNRSPYVSSARGTPSFPVPLTTNTADVSDVEMQRGTSTSTPTSINNTNNNLIKSRSSSNQGDTLQPSSSNPTILSNNTNNMMTSIPPQSAEWLDPGESDAVELRGMTAFEGGQDQFKERLGNLARLHWDNKLPSSSSTSTAPMIGSGVVKEAETVVNFAYAIRMRSKILKSAPMV